MNDIIAFEEEKVNSKKKSEAAGWIRFGLMLIGVYVFFHYVIGLSIINGDSMNPTFETNNVLLFNKVLLPYEHDNVVIFNNDYGFSVVKRIIGVPGDTVAIEDGRIFLNGEELIESYTAGISDDMNQVQVPEKSYFVLGDNRTPGESLDSRNAEVGFVKEESIEGNVLLSLIPFKVSFK